MINVISTVSLPTILGLLIRFQRVQVQLRAQEENTIKILKTIKRAKILEIVFVLALFIANLCFALGNYGDDIFDFSDNSARTIKITGQIFEFVFTSILCFSLQGVNRQLALFFDQVGITAYPNKSIVFLIATFFVVVIHQDAIAILIYYREVPVIYLYVSGWLNNVMYPAVFLTVTAAFLFLADFGFEVRAVQASAS